MTREELLTLDNILILTSRPGKIVGCLRRLCKWYRPSVLLVRSVANSGQCTDIDLSRPCMIL